MRPNQGREFAIPFREAKRTGSYWSCGRAMPLPRRAIVKPAQPLQDAGLSLPVFLKLAPMGSGTKPPLSPPGCVKQPQTASTLGTLHGCLLLSCRVVCCIVTMQYTVGVFAHTQLHTRKEITNLTSSYHHFSW